MEILHSTAGLFDNGELTLEKYLERLKLQIEKKNQNDFLIIIGPEARPLLFVGEEEVWVGTNTQ